MKIIAIGDIHGKTIWKDIIEKENPDKVVFIGDYFDTFEPMSGLEQIINFNNIIKYKLDNPDDIVVLKGNHDFHYLDGVPGDEQYSGFQHLHRYDIKDALRNAISKDLMQICYVYKEFLFSHAGVTKTWCEDNSIDLYDVENSINELFEGDKSPFCFVQSRGFKISDPYGFNNYQSPIWVRPSNLIMDKIEGYHQVVGHTRNATAYTMEGVTFIDCLDSSKEYFVYENEEIKFNKHGQE